MQPDTDSWGQGSTRASRRARAAALDRDGHQCQLKYDGCTRTATEADHVISITAIGQRRADATNPDDLQAACTHCHGIKTRRQAAAAKGYRSRRPKSPHPGNF